jgi:hypothetical protein
LLPVYLVPLSYQKEDMATMVQQEEDHEDHEDQEEDRDLEADAKL